MAFIEYKPEFKVGSYIMLQEELEVTGGYFTKGTILKCIKVEKSYDDFTYTWIDINEPNRTTCSYYKSISNDKFLTDKFAISGELSKLSNDEIIEYFKNKSNDEIIEYSKNKKSNKIKSFFKNIKS